MQNGSGCLRCPTGAAWIAVWLKRVDESTLITRTDEPQHPPVLLALTLHRGAWSLLILSISMAACRDLRRELPTNASATRNSSGLIAEPTVAPETAIPTQPVCLIQYVRLHSTPLIQMDEV